MVQLIDKDALAAKIEKRFDEYSSSILRHYDACIEARASELGKILVILNTLEVKEVDLEEKATQLSQKYFPDEENIWARSNIEAHKCKSACMKMVEWLKVQKGE